MDPMDLLVIPLALILKSEGGGLILQLFFWMSFFVVVGWSKLLMFTEPQTSKNHQKWRGSALKPLVLGKAVSCAVWEGLEGRREEIREK